MPQTIKQWWSETHILPSEVSKLVIPRTCSSVRTEKKKKKKKKTGKGDIILKAEMIPHILAYVTDFLFISIAP